MKVTTVPLHKLDAKKIIYVCPVHFTQATSKDILGKLSFKFCMILSIF